MPHDRTATEEPSPLVLSIGLVASGAMLLQVAFQLSLPLAVAWSPVMLGGVVLYGLAGLYLLLAARGSVRAGSRYDRAWLVLGAVLAVSVGRALLMLRQGDHPVSDATMYAELAARLLLQGENPYRWDLGGAFEVFGGTHALATPTLDGSYSVNLAYPALSFLVNVPLQLCGFMGHPTVHVASYLALVLLVFVGSRRAVRPVILLPLVLGVDFLSLGLVGSLDMIWVTLLVSMLVAWERPTLRAVLFGLAAAYKQQPWLVLPFLVVRIWRGQEAGRPVGRLLRFLAMGGATFVAINLPFLVWDPQAWVRGVLEPLRADMILLGQGLSGVTQFGYLQVSKGYFLFASAMVFGFLFWAYLRHYRTLRDAFWILPGIYIWFSYRSLMSYWAFLSIPAVAVIGLDRYAADAEQSAPQETVRAPSWRPTLFVGVSLAALLAAMLGVYSQMPARVELQLQPPYRTSDGRVSHLTVRVHNRSSEQLRPRFFVQHGASNPLPWRIVAGPMQLRPGASGKFHLLGPRAEHTFLAQEGALLTVGQADGNYNLRGQADIPPDDSFVWPDAIPNPRFLFWGVDQPTPLMWSLHVDEGATGAVQLVPLQGRQALRLSLRCGEAGQHQVALRNWVLFPSRPFELWVQRAGVDDPDRRYGVEVDDGRHRLWYLFGATTRTTRPAANYYVETRALPGAGWSRETIDLAALYRRAGWALPAPTSVAFRNIQAELPMVTLSLVLVGQGASVVRPAFFGPIVQRGYRQLRPSAVVVRHAD